MKGEVDIFQALLANVIVVVGFVVVILFIGEISVFNATITKPSVEIIQVIDLTHKIENCLQNSGVSEIQPKLDGCKFDAKYIEIVDLEGRSWKTGFKEEVKRDHSIWITIEGEAAKLYVKS